MSSSFETPWTIAHQAPLSMGFPRQEYWSGSPFPSPGESSQPRDGICICLMHWQAGSSPLRHQGSPKTCLVWINSFNFCLFEKVIICPLFLKNCLVSRIFLVGSFFLSMFWVYHPIAFWPAMFLLRNQLLVFWWFYSIWHITCLAAIKILSLSLIFVIWV